MSATKLLQRCKSCIAIRQTSTSQARANDIGDSTSNTVCFRFWPTQPVMTDKVLEFQLKQGFNSSLVSCSSQWSDEGSAEASQQEHTIFSCKLCVTQPPIQADSTSNSAQNLASCKLKHKPQFPEACQTHVAGFNKSGAPCREPRIRLHMLYLAFQGTAKQDTRKRSVAQAIC